MVLLNNSWRALVAVGVISMSLLAQGIEGSVANKTVLPSRNSGERDERFLSLFTIVRFPNTACIGANSYNGTCLTSSECSSYGGTASGTCASGFGVCCIVAIKTCGSTAKLNNTYWQNPGYPSSYTTSGQCSLFVEKINSNICQLRLDFVDFNLAQPEATATTSMGQCLTDSFTVSGSANLVPTICGINTNQHIYVHMTPGTSTFTLSILTSGTATWRAWDILIRQIPCGTTYTAPDRCLQWYTEGSGTLTSFNYQYAANPTVQHLAYQDYTICLRTNQGFCGVKYAVCSTAVPSFLLTAATGGTTNFATSAVDAACSTDWLHIPCASDVQNSITISSPATTGCATKICGQALNVVGLAPAATAAQTSTTVYSYRRPFDLRFYTDGSDATTEAIGFCLTYVQQPCLTTIIG